MPPKTSTLQIVAPAKAENLHAIANDINATHAAAKSHAQLAVVFALRTGSLCAQAKAAIEHGAFGAWLEKNCPQITDRTAQNYMRLVTAAKNETVSLLTNGTVDLTGPDFLARIEGDSKYREKVLTEVHDVFGEGSLTDLYKDYGVIHGPRNEDVDGKRVHHPAKKLSPDQIARQNRAAAKALIVRALGDLKAALDDKQAKRWLEPKDWTDIRRLAQDRMKQLNTIADKAEAAAQRTEVREQKTAGGKS